MMKRSYSKGCLLWVDDNFALKSFLSEGGDHDVWTRTFGDTEHRVYRLLGLHLALATSLDQARKVIKFLESPQHLDTFIVGVVDLRIPRHDGGEPDVKYGLQLAGELYKKGIRFSFLSAKRSETALEELKKEKLEAIAYYPKKSSDGRIMMPESLARAILTEFRNRISWINLQNLYQGLDEYRSTYPGMHKEGRRNKKALLHFPFIGAFRDFVERWEHRPLQRRNLTFVLRCPEDHSDEFVVQCLMIILSQLITGEGDIALKYYNLVDQNEADRFMKADFSVGQDILVFRIHSELNINLKSSSTVMQQNYQKSAVPPERIAELANRTKEATTVFIVPNDDSADPYLEVLPRYQGTYYDDLPLIRDGDQIAREELIRRAAEFVFQRCRLKVDGQPERPLNKLYLNYPEIAINPFNWVALMESKDVEEDLSDPYEILDVFYRVTDELDNLEPENKERLIAGEPLPYDKLLLVAENEIRQKDPVIHHISWYRRALDLWLSSSWHFPFGLSTRVGRPISEQQLYDEKWEDHCLEVAVELSRAYEETEATLGMNGNNPLVQSLMRAKRFLEHPSVKNLIENDQANDDYEGLSFLRWPHLRYPLPAALSRRLKKAGRFLWVQRDYLDLTSVLPAGHSAYELLDTVLGEYARNLNWMKTVSSTLPEGWKQSVEYFTELIESREVKQRWNFNRSEVWDPLLGLLRNALPVSLVYHYVLAGKPLTGNSKNSALHALTKTKGYGTLLAKIRGKRSYALRYGLKMQKRDTRSREQSLKKIRTYGKLAEQYAGAHEDQGRNKLNDLVDFLIELTAAVSKDKRLDEGYGEKNNISDSFAQPLIDIMMHPEFALDEDWYVKPNQLDLNKIDDSILPSIHMPSLFGSKSDFLWHALDLLNYIRIVTSPFRCYDGYSLLACIGDLRILDKDSAPETDSKVIEEIMQILFWSLQGLVAQLKFCLNMMEFPTAEHIPLDALKLETPPDFKKPNKSDMKKLMRIREKNDGRYELFVRGIPGSRTVSNFAYHCKGKVLLWDEKKRERKKRTAKKSTSKT